jgi:prepilin signal peptidase PulO-like enzyme (type II secretory pathway)
MAPLLPLVFVAGLGLILGSFLNAFSFRFNTGHLSSLLSPTSSGRSRCMRCSHVLGVSDLVPVFSFMFLRGRCRYCGSKISWQYPLVETAASLVAVIIYLQSPEPFWFAYWFLVWLVMLFIIVYDLRHKIIPWSASLTLLALALIHAALFGTWWGVALAAPLLLISLVSRGRWMGWGDGFLELSLGLLLGLTAGLTALLFAFWAGALVGIALMAGQRGVTMKTEVPFAPFLILGAAAAYFLHADLFSSMPALF